MCKEINNDITIPVDKSQYIVIPCDSVKNKVVANFSKEDEKDISVIIGDSNIDVKLISENPHYPIFFITDSESILSGEAEKIYSSVISKFKGIVWPIMLISVDSESSINKLPLSTFKYASIFCSQDYDDVTEAMCDYIVTISRGYVNYSINIIEGWHYHFSEYILDHIYSKNHEYHYYDVLDHCCNRVIGCPKEISRNGERLLLGSNINLDKFIIKMSNIYGGVLHSFRPYDNDDFEKLKKAMERIRSSCLELDWDEKKEVLTCEWNGWKENLFSIFVTVKI